VTRALCLVALVGVAALPSACAGDAQKPAAAPGSPENPLVAKTTEGGSTGRSNEADGKGAAPGYQKLVDRQASKPDRRFTPCNLVTRAEAKAILDAPVQALREAPQGPTCVYRGDPGKQFITLAVQSLDFDRIRKQIRRPHAVHVANRRAYCSEYGQPMLYVSLTHGRVLTVGAPCRVARQFATRGVKRLSE
jgi:hypothetical protein